MELKSSPPVGKFRTRKSPGKRIFLEDEYINFVVNCIISTLNYVTK